MSFDVTADAYGHFMGRYAEPLAALFVDQADVRPGMRALDVGCGPGALTARLVDRLGANAVAGVDPSPPFVAASQDRFPDVDVRAGVAEDLPFPDATFDVALAQLVVHFMDDPVAGLREMGRVTNPGGTVTACVWDHQGGSGPIALFWQAVRTMDPNHPGERDMAGTGEGHLAELCAAAGLQDIESSSLTVRVGYDSFESWWEPYLMGVGPAGAYVNQLDDASREVLRLRCSELTPAAPFEVSATAWCVRARA